MQVFRNTLSQLEGSLEILLVKIYAVDSETFKNYKFKEVARMFERLVVELQTFGILDFMPSLSKLILKMRYTTASALLKT